MKVKVAYTILTTKEVEVDDKFEALSCDHPEYDDLKVVDELKLMDELVLECSKAIGEGCVVQVFHAETDEILADT